MLIDLNCDMGEGMSSDADIFPYITSANIACGYHAGDPDIMRRTVELALRHKVHIGAHPSYPDRANFGRTDMLGSGIGLSEIGGLIVDQLMILQAICDELGARMHHVKPHGALYNRAARDPEVSAAICQAIRQLDPSLRLYGLSGSVMADAAAQHGLFFVHEVFADRTYQADGSLTPRTASGALIEDASVALQHVLRMINEGVVVAVTGEEVPIIAQTVCLHGDGAHAVEFAKIISKKLHVCCQ